MSEYRTANQSLVALARRDLTEFWEALNTAGNPLLVKAALLEFFPELITAYGDTAAVLGADWYDALRYAPPSAASFRALLADPPNIEQAEVSARWALGPLFQAEPDPVSALSLLGGATQRLVLQAGRDTVFRSASQDPVRTGFARIPVGVTCKFCTMVASRGFVYHTAASAGESNQWHDDCDCVIAPGRSPEDLPEGYDLGELERLYREGSGIGRDVPAS